MPKADENKSLNNKIRKLAPDAIDAMGDMLRDPHTPAPTKAQIIGFILERTLGKPDTTIHLMTAGSTIKDSENRLIALAEEIRETNTNLELKLDNSKLNETPGNEEDCDEDHNCISDEEGEMNGYPEE